MFEYISKHFRLVVIIGIAILLVLFTVLFFLSRSGNIPNIGQNNNSEYLSGQQYLEDKNISDADKYLMITGVIVAEDYGTYSPQNYNNLTDLLNKSSERFKPTVQKMIQNLPNSKGITTVVDDTSVRFLGIDDSTVTVTMNGVTTDSSNNKVNVAISVSLIKENDYWVADKIVFTK